MSPRRRSPRPIGNALVALRTTWEPPSPLGKAQTAWEQVGHAWAEVVGAHGPYVVERTQLVKLSGGLLTIRCAEAAVTETLTLQSESILERLNQRLDGEPIRRLRCVTGS